LASERGAYRALILTVRARAVGRWSPRSPWPDSPVERCAWRLGQDRPDDRRGPPPASTSTGKTVRS